MRKAERNPKRLCGFAARTGGMTLVEVMVSFVILAVASVVVVTGFFAVARVTADTDRKTVDAADTERTVAMVDADDPGFAQISEDSISLSADADSYRIPVTTYDFQTTSDSAVHYGIVAYRSAGADGEDDEEGGGAAADDDEEPPPPPIDRAPIISLNGASVLRLQVGDPFTDPGATAHDDRDGDLTASIVVSGSADTGVTGVYTLTYTVTDSAGNTASKSRLVIVHTADALSEYGFTGNVQTFTATRNGVYRFECWGAGAAPVGNANSGKGAYTSGEIWMRAGDTIYIYVGGNTSAFNGSAKSGRGNFSGGSTDIRLSKTAWNDTIGLRSRIMVAAGGGTYGATNKPGGFGGGLTGQARGESYGSGGEGGGQTAGGARAGFGFGGSGLAQSGGYGGAGGGGYYGGGGATPDGSGDDDRGGGGGSSFVSGFAGCNAIKWVTIATHTGAANHYSGRTFQNPRMIAGNAAMPNTAGTGNMTGNAGAGHARVSLIEADATDILLVDAEEFYQNPVTAYFRSYLDLGTPYIEPGYFAWDPTDGVVTDRVVVEGDDFDVFALGDYDVTYSYTNSMGQTATAVRRVTVRPVRQEFAYTGEVQTFTAFSEGTYKIELWGAGSAPASGNGAYTSGEITLQKGDTLYVYVGGNTAAFNGSAASGRAGVRSGGATDVRLVNTAWNDASGLRSRIMVAAGGGSYGAASRPGGFGGGLTGQSRGESYGSGGEGGGQTAGGTRAGFGFGGSGLGQSGGYGGAGGGGYYGGGGVTPDGSGDDDRGGGGGSSYISGYTGVNSVTSATDGRHTGSVNHYSGLTFRNGLMIPGNGTMEDPTLPFTMAGNARAGHARIGLVEKPETRIALNGSVDMSIDVGTPYVEPGYSATDYYEGDVTGKVTVTGADFDVFRLGTYAIDYSYTNLLGHTFTVTRKVTVEPVTQDFTYTGAAQTFTAPSTGMYRVELWGSVSSPASGNGAYTRGEIFLSKGQSLQVYVGGNASAFNGSAASGRSGVRSGGATDVRLINAAWNDADSLRSRIMVAAGGGSYGAPGNAGGPGGGLTGGNGNGTYGGGGIGGTQTGGGANNGVFGGGGNGTAGSGGYGGGGGAGYYGGGGAGTDGSGDDDRGGGGGSSF
ncbi:MAG: DUF5011 domain-containing protein, partial [Clostridiales Family XIII bacterium]|nr:DUF5011 domain-containing protein [Clostridiales Family XIII bacterium]